MSPARSLRALFGRVATEAGRSPGPLSHRGRGFAAAACTAGEEQVVPREDDPRPVSRGSSLCSSRQRRVSADAPGSAERAARKRRVVVVGTARVVFDTWDGRYAAAMGSVRASAVRDLFAAASRPDMISLSGGMPDVRRVPHEAVERAVRDALEHDGAAALQYGCSEGRVALRGTIVDLMAESGVRLKEDDLIVTAGAQQALDLLAKRLHRPRRHDRHRGAHLRRRAAGVLGVPPTRGVRADGRARDAHGPAGGHAPAARASRARSSSTRSRTSRTPPASRCPPSAGAGWSSSRTSTTSRSSRTTRTGGCGSKAGT